MAKIWTYRRSWQLLGQGLLGLLLGTQAFAYCLNPSSGGPARLSRKPANWVPNDDVIVVPVDAEISFYEQHVLNDESWKDSSRVKQQIKMWQENENMAQAYGVDTSAAGNQYYIPNSEEKWQYVQRSYFRYLTKKGQTPLQDTSREVWQQWTADDEINSIDEMEAAFKTSNRLRRKNGSVPQALRDKSLVKAKKFRFHFQPRIEQGLIIMRMESAYVDARAWVGFNGQSEVNVERYIESTGTRMMVNYFTFDGQYLSALDQKITGPLSARITHTWNPELNEGYANERRFMLRYFTEF